MTTAYTTDTRFAGHTLEGHPEHAGRLTAIADRLRQTELPARLLHVPPRPATESELEAAHAARYLEALAQTRGLPLSMADPDTYITPDSYELARLAAGACLAVTDRIMEGSAQNGLAAIRPPGHHATPVKAMGFCLLNNAAVAARYLQQRHRLERVAIVDYDVHHGNGTQDIFWDDPSVLYISMHQWPLYPGTGRADETGHGAGEGATVNLPLPLRVGDAGYRAAAEAVVLPALRRFAPEFVIVSIGFDAHWRDPLAQMLLTLHGYDWLTRQLLAVVAEFCQGRLLVVLEGGYNLDILSTGWLDTIRALLGDDAIDDPFGAPTSPEGDATDVIARVQRIHKLS